MVLVIRSTVLAIRSTVLAIRSITGAASLLGSVGFIRGEERKNV